MYPWGNELTPGGGYRANLWQGDFPRSNTADDGFSFAGPVGSYAPQTATGLHDLIGSLGVGVRLVVRAGGVGPRRRAPGPGGAERGRREAQEGRLVPLPQVLLLPLPERRAPQELARLGVEQQRHALRPRRGRLNRPFLRHVEGQHLRVAVDSMIAVWQ